TEPSISSPSRITDRQEPEIPQYQGPTPTPVSDEATTTSVEVDAEGATTTTASLKARLGSGNIHESPLRCHDAPLPEVNISGSVEDSELTKTTQIFRNEVLTLKRKSKKVVLSESEGEEAENSSKQGMKTKTLTQVASGDVSTYKRIRRSVDTGMDYFSVAKERTKSEEVNTGSTLDKAQRKRKAKMVEENVQTVQKTKKQLEQEKAGLQKVSAKLEANAELVKNMQGEGLSEEDFAKRMVDMINQRKKYFAKERAKAKRSKPMTQTQLRTYMSNYLKNQGTWKLSQLKKLTFEEIKEKFDKLVNQIDTFVPMGLEATKARMKRYSEVLQTGTLKKQKTVDNLGFAELQEKVAGMCLITHTFYL
ncbi:hypothetical protein Tco_1551847, partial [Tanacetum coccineum]